MMNLDVNYEQVKELTDKVQEKMSDLPEELCKNLVGLVIDSVHELLIDKGQVYITDQIQLKIVPIKARKHTLRGIQYESKRLYKLRPILGDKLYDRIYDAYNKLRIDN